MSGRPSPLTSAAAALKPIAGTATPASCETSTEAQPARRDQAVLEQDLLADRREEDVEVAVVVEVERRAAPTPLAAGRMPVSALASRKRPSPSFRYSQLRPGPVTKTSSQPSPFQSPAAAPCQVKPTFGGSP